MSAYHVRFISLKGLYSGPAPAKIRFDSRLLAYFGSRVQALVRSVLERDFLRIDTQGVIPQSTLEQISTGIATV
jgi:hypothetical protein